MSLPSPPDRPRVLRATAQTASLSATPLTRTGWFRFFRPGSRPTYERGAYVSLVGVELTGVRVFGLTGPGLRRVPAVELRIHVPREQGPPDERGTWTHRAYVSRRTVTWAARLFYGETMHVTSMQAVRRRRGEALEGPYRFDWKGREQRVRVRGEAFPVPSGADALARSLPNPVWHFGAVPNGSLLRTYVKRFSGALYRGSNTTLRCSGRPYTERQLGVSSRTGFQPTCSCRPGHRWPCSGGSVCDEGSRRLRETRLGPPLGSWTEARWGRPGPGRETADDRGDR